MSEPEEKSVPKFLSNEFDNIELIGAGGMGQVYGALDKSGRKVAIKVLREEVRTDSTFMARIDREAAIASSGLHPGLVKLLDKRLDDEACYLVFEFVEGRTLTELLKSERPLAIDRAMSLFRKLVECLAALHSKGLVHRDIKPDNIMVEPKGCLRLLDFGIARGGDFDTVTKTGSILGTPAFLAPEQILGKKATARVDVFALGLLLLDCLSPKTPFAKTAQKPLAEQLSLRAKGQEHFQRPPALPAPLWNFILRLIQKDPLKRPADCNEVMVALEELAAMKMLTSSNDNRTKIVATVPPKGRPLWLLAPLAALISIGAILLSNHEAERPPPTKVSTRYQGFTRAKYLELLDEAIAENPARIDRKELKLVPPGEARREFQGAIIEQLLRMPFQFLGKTSENPTRAYNRLRAYQASRLALVTLYIEQLEPTLTLAEQNFFYFVFGYMKAITNFYKVLIELQSIASKERSKGFFAKDPNALSSKVCNEIHNGCSKLIKLFPKDVLVLNEELRKGKRGAELEEYLQLVETLLHIEFGPISEATKNVESFVFPKEPTKVIGDLALSRISLNFYVKFRYFVNRNARAEQDAIAALLLPFLGKSQNCDQYALHCQIALNVNNMSIFRDLRTNQTMGRVNKGLERAVKALLGMRADFRAELERQWFSKIKRSRPSLASELAKQLGYERIPD